MEKENIFLRAKFLDIKTGHPWIVVLHEDDAKMNGIYAGNKLILKWGKKQTEVTADLSKELVQKGEIGLFKDIIEKYPIKEGEIIEIFLAPTPSSLEAIRKKLKGQKLTYEEILTIISDVVNYHLDDIQIAFFVASAFLENNFSLKEIYYLTKAISETGQKIYWNKETIADKHSIGGLPNNRTTPIVVPIIASLNIFIPKTSSRAVTSACGTADVVESIAKVEFDLETIKRIVEKTNGCLVWGGALKLAPADDRLLKVSYELGIEPFSKMIVSIMAKKVAMGATHLVIDLPVKRGTKISHYSDALKIKDTFIKLGKMFNIQTGVLIDEIKYPIVGNGVGPLLEIIDVLKILEQNSGRSLYLEERALKLAGLLLEILKKAPRGKGIKLAQKQLQNGEALKKFQEIIATQGGKRNITSKDLSLKEPYYDVVCKKSGCLKDIDPFKINRLVRLLGAPTIKEAGILFFKKVGEKLVEGEPICRLYSNSEQRINLALEELTSENNIFTII
ncbi:MAG: thymidine phosphorylase [Candidatus Paceibacterota bacterium]